MLGTKHVNSWEVRRIFYLDILRVALCFLLLILPIIAKFGGWHLYFFRRSPVFDLPFNGAVTIYKKMDITAIAKGQMSLPGRCA